MSQSSLGNPSEADLIETLFAPLTLGHAGAFHLTDDVAFLAPAQHGLIVTQDQIIEGTHFLPDDPLDMMARRLVRRNLSDMIAKGGIPTAAFLSLAWPKARDRAGMAGFIGGLGDDLAQLCGQCPLMGGDTSETSGHLVASLTMMGRPTAAHGGPVLRRGAQVGDVIAVTGVIGDAWLGLQARKGLLNRSQLQASSLFSVAPCPPNLTVAPLIGRYAHASIDVSDGLVIDAVRLAKASGLAMALDLALMPLSQEAARFEDIGCDRERAIVLATGGDDYQPLVALSPLDFPAYASNCDAAGVRVTQIGVCREGQGVQLSYGAIAIDMPSTTGWQI